MAGYMNFVSQIPNEILQKTEMHLCSNIALFKPVVYLGGITLNASDYHMVIPSEKPPDTYFNNKIVHLDQRQILTINPGDFISCSRNIRTKQYYSLLIKSSLLHKVAREMGFTDEIRFTNILNPLSGELLQVLKNFERESRRPDRINLMLECLEIQIAALLLRNFPTNVRQCNPESPDVDSYIQLAKEYMRTYYSSNITIDDICHKIHISHFHFIRMFKQKVGLSPHQYLHNVRIEKAKELLGIRNNSIAETAALCGFVSAAHFSTKFKQATGFSPSEYRSRLQ